MKNSLDYRTAKAGRAVNGSAFAPFILAVDGFGRVCKFYLNCVFCASVPIE